MSDLFAFKAKNDHGSSAQLLEYASCPKTVDDEKAPKVINWDGSPVLRAGADMSQSGVTNSGSGVPTSLILNSPSSDSERDPFVYDPEREWQRFIDSSLAPGRMKVKYK